MLDPWSNWADAAEKKRKDKIAEAAAAKQLGMAQNREALARNVGGANQGILSDLYARVMGHPLAQKPIDWSQPTGAAPVAGAPTPGQQTGTAAPPPPMAAPQAQYHGPVNAKQMPMPGEPGPDEEKEGEA